MATSVRITVEDRGVRRMLRSMGDLKFRTPLRQSGVYMEGSIGKRFRRANWVRLSPATIKAHPHRAGGKPLNDTGKLRMSITSRAVKHVTKNKLEYGTNLAYAPMHNFGGVGGWGKRIPKREFLFFDNKDERAVKRIFEDYVRRLSNGG